MLGGLSSYFGEVSHSIQTGSVIRRTLFDTGGVVAEDGNVTRRPVPAACRGKQSPQRQSPRRSRIPWNSTPSNASEYHLIDLAACFSEGGFATLAGARQGAREKGLAAWESSTAMFGLSTTIRVQTNR